MTKCPGCSEPVTPTEEECSYCGTPLRDLEDLGKRPIVAGRRTYIEKKEAGSLYVPKSRRGSPSSPPGSALASPADPFLSALGKGLSPVETKPIGAGMPRKVTQFGGATDEAKVTIVGASVSASSPSDPWAAAIAEGPASEQAGSRIRAQEAGGLVGAVLNFSGDSRGELYPVRLGRTFLGRKGDSGLHIEIDDGKVSSPHCVLVARESGVFLQDHMSTNGTYFRRGEEGEFVDLQVEMNNSAQLQNRDFFQVGDSVLQFLAFDRAQIRRIWG